jgi:hypothetical protein
VSIQDHYNITYKSFTVSVPLDPFLLSAVQQFVGSGNSISGDRQIKRPIPPAISPVSSVPENGQGESAESPTNYITENRLKPYTLQH